MKILVTGGAGFIASHIVDAYIKEGLEVMVVDNLSSGKHENLNPEAHFVQLDITNIQLADLINEFQPEVINHHAAQINVRKSLEDPGVDAEVNILGSINVCEAAVKAGSVKKVIFASTGGAIYGDADTLPTVENYPAKPISPYGIAKLSVEHYLYYYTQVHQLPCLALRYSNVYGPRQNPHGEAGVVAIFYQRILAGEPFSINGTGEQTRDFVQVADVVRANILATHSSETGSINIGTGKETSISQLVEMMKSTLGYNQEIQHVPAKPGEQQRSCLSNAKAASSLQWHPQIDLEKGLAETAAFFKQAV